jgi:hypothetical protein
MGSRIFVNALLAGAAAGAQPTNTSAPMNNPAITRLIILSRSSEFPTAQFIIDH